MAESTGLSQLQRVTCTFTAPSKTFEDIKRGNRSWWLPFLITILAGYVLFAAITVKVGWGQVADNVLRADEKTQEKLASAPPEARATALKFTQYSIEGGFAATPLIVLAVTALGSLGLWGTINFVFSGKATYGSIFAVWIYADMPRIFKSLLGAVAIFAGGAPESFNLENFAPTSIGAFLPQQETPKALYVLASWLDATTIWSLVVLAIGTAIVARVKRNSGYIAVFGWWALFLLISVGWAAINS